jgi:hypothetical protein
MLMRTAHLRADLPQRQAPGFQPQRQLPLLNGQMSGHPATSSAPGEKRLKRLIVIAVVESRLDRDMFDIAGTVILTALAHFRW